MSQPLASSGVDTASPGAVATANAPANILLVDDQPAKLLSYEVILRELGENVIKAASAREALECLLKHDIAVVLVDVCMPELDGFQLAAMIREHPRFQRTAIIFISAIHLSDSDRLRGYAMGAVDYVPVPVIPEVLRAKVRVFIELFRKTRQLETFNRELERRVAERTDELSALATRLLQSEQLRSLALAAGQMGSWEWDAVTGKIFWDEGQHRIFGVEPGRFAVTAENIQSLIHPEDWLRLREEAAAAADGAKSHHSEFRVRRPNGELRWCVGSAAASVDASRRVLRVAGVTVDITDRKNAEDRQEFLIREVDHRARNALAVVQSIVRLTHAKSKEAYMAAVEGRITALARAHMLLSDRRWAGASLGTLLDEELSPYRSNKSHISVSGPDTTLQPAAAQIMALTLHELATNAAKFGALSLPSGHVRLEWAHKNGRLVLAWDETGGPPVEAPKSDGFGIRAIKASIDRQLDGRTSFDWRRDGLHFNMSIPLGPAENGADAKNGTDAGPFEPTSVSKTRAGN